MSEIWAKSAPSGCERLSLWQHTRDVMDVAQRMFGPVGCSTRLGRAWLRFFKLDAGMFECFARTLCAAAGFHDFGKANDGFQQSILRTGEQAIRHEHFSALLMSHPACWSWLTRHGGIDWVVALSAVLTHHLKAPMANPIRPLSAARKSVCLLLGPKFDTLTEVICGFLKSPKTWPGLPEVWTFDRSGSGEQIAPRVRGLQDLLEEFDSNCDDNRKRFLRAVRAALIAADAAASGLTREEYSVEQWLSECFDESILCNRQYVYDSIINPRIYELGGRWKGWHKFQDGAAEQPARTLMLSPCGSGKTLAAWRWIAAQVKKPVKACHLFVPHACDSYRRVQRLRRVGA